MSLPPIAGALTDSVRFGTRRRNVPIVEKGVSREEDALAERSEILQGEIRKGGHAVIAGNNAVRRRKPPEPKSSRALKDGGSRRSSLIRRNSKLGLETGRPVKLRPLKANSERIPPELLRRAKDLFNEFDHDGNGVIDAAELRAVMKSLGHELQPKEIQQMLDMVDQNQSGNIDMREFLDMLHEVNDMDLFRGGSADVANAVSLAHVLAGGSDPKFDVSPETSIDTSALKKILQEDFDLHDFRIEEVLPGPITFNSLQMFLLDGKAY